MTRHACLWNGGPVHSDSEPQAWLRDRPAKVVVAGKLSQDLTLSNMVFQGTVWGPLLWNVFYEDAATPVRKAGFTEAVYADDLNAFKEVSVRVCNEEALELARIPIKLSSI